jgi:hypothetical protein
MNKLEPPAGVSQKYAAFISLCEAALADQRHAMAIFWAGLASAELASATCEKAALPQD